MDEEKLNQIIAEAEQRGYERGLNAQIDKQMERPGVWEQPPQPDNPEEYQILAFPRPSIWNN